MTPRHCLKKDKKQSAVTPDLSAREMGIRHHNVLIVSWSLAIIFNDLKQRHWQEFVLRSFQEFCFRLFLVYLFHPFSVEFANQRMSVGGSELDPDLLGILT